MKVFFLPAVISTFCLFGCSDNSADLNGPLNDLQSEVRQRFLTAFESYETADLMTGMKHYHGQSLAMAGREDIIIEDGILTSPDSTCPQDRASDPSANIVNQIMNVVGDHRVVIINEDHSVSRDRQLIAELLAPLQKAGFTHYAAETFPPTIADKQSDKAIVGMGYYSNEPLFGQLITRAISSGYTLVAYEQTEAQRGPEDMTWQEKIPLRETAQSENLAAVLKTMAPEEKILVHVGHSHVAEKPIPNRDGTDATDWMALRLKAITGLDPLTISQTACSTTGPEPYLSSERQNASGGDMGLFTDYAIAHPPIRIEQGRPSWLTQNRAERVNIPPSLRDETQTLLYEVRRLDHPDAAVPTDRLLLSPDDADIPLILPKGNYRIEAFSKDGRYGKAVVVKVGETD